LRGTGVAESREALTTGFIVTAALRRSREYHCRPAVIVASKHHTAQFHKTKFHYAIQVADLAFDKFVRVCDQLATFWVESRSQTSSSYLGMSRYSSNLFATAGRKLQVCDQVCDLDSIMEFGLYCTNMTDIRTLYSGR